METNTEKKSIVLNLILWGVQGLLFLFFMGLGSMKIVQPEKLPFPWIAQSPSLALLTGLVDVLGGIGILLPALLRIQPKLTIFAAYGIILLMVAGSIFHISRGESEAIGFNIFVALLALFVAWGRQTKAVILPKE